MREYGEVLSTVHKEFDGLDSRLTEVGNTAIRIGEQLETIGMSCHHFSTYHSEEG